MGVQPMMGKYGAIGIAAQTAVGTPAAAPTLWLPTKQFFAPVGKHIITEEEFADGTIFSGISTDQGVESGSVQLNFIPTLNSVTQLLVWMFNNQGTNGEIVPRMDNFAALAPGTPLTVWQLHPVRNTIMQDVQIPNLTLNVSGRQTVDAQLTVAATSRKEYTGAALTPVVALDDRLVFKHFYAYFNGQKFRPKDANLVFDVPMEAQDGAQGEEAEDVRNYPVGWERSGAVKATSRITVGVQDTMTGILANYEGNTAAEYRAGFQVAPGKVLETTFDKANITSADPATGLGLIDLPTELTSSFNGGLPTFRISKAPVLTP